MVASEVKSIIGSTIISGYDPPGILAIRTEVLVVTINSGSAGRPVSHRLISLSKSTSLSIVAIVVVVVASVVSGSSGALQGS